MTIFVAKQQLVKLKVSMENMMPTKTTKKMEMKITFMKRKMMMMTTIMRLVTYQ